MRQEEGSASPRALPLRSRLRDKGLESRQIQRAWIHVATDDEPRRAGDAEVFKDRGTARVVTSPF